MPVDPSTETLVRFLAPLGVGGVLAGFIFYFYRRDITSLVGALKDERSELLKIVRGNAEAMTKIEAAISSNTHVLENLAASCRATQWRGDTHRERPDG
jgi:hypothetical protein